MINHLTDNGLNWIVGKLKWLWLDAFGFHATTTTINGDVITQVKGNIKIVTNMESDNRIVDQLYKDNVLQSTKVTTISTDGNTITEVIN